MRKRLIGINSHEKIMKLDDNIILIFERYFGKYDDYSDGLCDENFEKLERLIRNKGVNLGYSNFEKLYDLMYKKYYYKKFRIEYDGLNFISLDEYIAYFLKNLDYFDIWDESYRESIEAPISFDDEFDVDDTDYLNFVCFFMYLIEKGLIFNNKSHVAATIKEILIVSSLDFERELFKGTYGSTVTEKIDNTIPQIFERYFENNPYYDDGFYDEDTEKLKYLVQAKGFRGDESDFEDLYNASFKKCRYNKFKLT